MLPHVLMCYYRLAQMNCSRKLEADSPLAYAGLVLQLGVGSHLQHMTSMVALTVAGRAVAWGATEEDSWEVYVQPEIGTRCFCHILLDRTSYLATPIARDPGKCSAAKGPVGQETAFGGQSAL